MDYFELAQASSIRMCWALEKRFPDFRGNQLELMRLLCLCAYNSEIYDGVCPDAWLKTTITLKSHDPHIFSPSDESPKLPELLELRDANIVDLCQASWKCLKEYNSSLTEKIELRSNILPRKAYCERLRELQHSSYWTRVLLQLSMLDYWRIIPCLINRRGFFPITIINQALEEGGSLKEKVTEWRQTGGTSCDLATHFRRPAVPDWHRRSELRKINRDDVKYSMKKDTMEKDILGKGRTGTVYKVAWRNGTYAMKSYRYSDESLKEKDTASKILHPHIVHSFGYGEVDGQCCLLREVLRTTLTDHAVEKVRARNTSLASVLSCLRGVSAEPLFSREDTFDVLLQIASALEHSHLNDVVNGDVKSDNVLLDHFEMLGQGRYFLAKVTDFGDAKEIIQGDDFRPAGDGTTKYAAPQLLEWRSSRERWLAHPKKMDVYGFGGIAYEVLTGYPVYHGCDSSKKEFLEGVIRGDLKPSGSELWRNSGLRERFPAGLIDLVEKCWELRPESRPSFTDICAELELCKARAQRRQCNRAANLWKFTAAVLLVAFICFLPLLRDDPQKTFKLSFLEKSSFTITVVKKLVHAIHVLERRVADCIDFIVLILFFFILASLVLHSYPTS